MWGEIEPCPKPSSPVNCEEPDCKADLDASVSESELSCYDSPPVPKGQSRCNTEAEGECSSSVSAMIEAVAISGSPVKSQQIGDPDLTMGERREALLEQYRSKPLVFLERYQAHLKPDHLGVFSHLSTDCRAQYYCKEIQRRASSQTARTRVRNQRYAALRALQQEGQYFSEEQMRVRDPLLYEQYIGQYLSEEEIFQRSEAAMQRGTGGLADLLINSYQEKVLQSRLQQQQDREECAEEEFDEEDRNGMSGEQGWEPSPEEKALLKEEFVSQMHQRFLDGKDKDFNYSEVDENPDYDNLDIVSRDAEDRYFDEDDKEEEEEEDDNDDDEEEDMIQ